MGDPKRERKLLEKFIKTAKMGSKVEITKRPAEELYEKAMTVITGSLLELNPIKGYCRSIDTFKKTVTKTIFYNYFKLYPDTNMVQDNEEKLLSYGLQVFGFQLPKINQVVPNKVHISDNYGFINACSEIVAKTYLIFRFLCRIPTTLAEEFLKSIWDIYKKYIKLKIDANMDRKIVGTILLCNIPYYFRVFRLATYYFLYIATALTIYEGLLRETPLNRAYKNLPRNAFMYDILDCCKILSEEFLYGERKWVGWYELMNIITNNNDIRKILEDYMKKGLSPYDIYKKIKGKELKIGDGKTMIAMNYLQRRIYTSVFKPFISFGILTKPLSKQTSAIIRAKKLVGTNVGFYEISISPGYNFILEVQYALLSLIIAYYMAIEERQSNDPHMEHLYNVLDSIEKYLEQV